MRYSIDTSAILDGWRRYYPPDVFPPLWTKLEALILDGTILSTEEVLFELEKKDDEVYRWALRQKQKFVPVDGPTQSTVSSILGSHPKLIDTRRGRSAADPFVIAVAQIHSCTVVTGERATNNGNRPNIPDVCTALGIRTINLLSLMREIGLVFRS